MRVTTSQSLTSGKNNAHFLSHNLPVYPLEKKFIGTSSILARRKCRLLPIETAAVCLSFEYNLQCSLLVLHLFSPHHRMFQ